LIVLKIARDVLLICSDFSEWYSEARYNGCWSKGSWNSALIKLSQPGRRWSPDQATKQNLNNRIVTVNEDESAILQMILFLWGLYATDKWWRV